MAVFPTDTFKIRSAYLQDEREVWVQKPNGYDTTSKSYPVLLLLDADGHFNYVKQYLPYLHSQFNKDIPAMVTVSLRSTNRSAIFTPKTGLPRYDTLPGRGRADDHLDFIEKELLPMLMQKYRLKDFRIVMGHSLGGLFAFYSMIKRPGLFQGIISASASVSYAGSHYINEYLPQLLKTKFNDTCFIYFTVADNDMTGYLDANNKMAAAFEATKNSTFVWQYRVMKGYNHWTVAPPSFYEGLLQMFALPAYKSMIAQ